MGVGRSEAKVKVIAGEEVKDLRDKVVERNIQIKVGWRGSRWGLLKKKYLRGVRRDI